MVSFLATTRDRPLVLLRSYYDDGCSSTETDSPRSSPRSFISICPITVACDNLTRPCPCQAVHTQILGVFQVANQRHRFWTVNDPFFSPPGIRTRSTSHLSSIFPYLTAASATSLRQADPIPCMEIASCAVNFRHDVGDKASCPLSTGMLPAFCRQNTKDCPYRHTNAIRAAHRRPLSRSTGKLSCSCSAVRAEIPNAHVSVPASPAYSW